MANIGERLKKLRLERKMSTRELGVKLNVNQSHISKIENGINNPSPKFIQNAAEYFNVDEGYFFISDQDFNAYSTNEKDLLFERKLRPEDLKEKYDLIIDGREATDEEIEEAIKYIKAIRIMNNNKNT